MQHKSDRCVKVNDLGKKLKNEQTLKSKYSKLVNELKTPKEMLQNQLLEILFENDGQEPAHYC